jgi:uncharacterized protein
MSATDPMRRGEREITEPAELEGILREASLLFLALQDESAPYVIPLCFGWEPGRLYFHSAREGRKLECIRRQPRVGFSACVDPGVVTAEAACDFASVGRSVVGTGLARIVSDEGQRAHAMDLIVRHYATHPPRGGYRPASLARTCLIEVAIETLRGKRVG